MTVKLSFIFAFFLIIFAAAEANAQLCGKYRTTLVVKTAAGAPVRNATIKVTPVADQNKIFGGEFRAEKIGSERLYAEFGEGYKVKGKYSVVVSGVGYTDASGEFNFPHCASRVFAVTLQPKQSGESSTIERLVIMRGETFDDEKTRIVGVSITAVAAEGEKAFRARVDPFGRFAFEIAPGNYTLTYAKKGYKTLKIVNAVIEAGKHYYLYAVTLEKGNPAETIEKDFKDLYKSSDIY